MPNSNIGDCIGIRYCVLYTMFCIFYILAGMDYITEEL